MHRIIKKTPQADNFKRFSRVVYGKVFYTFLYHKLPLTILFFVTPILAQSAYFAFAQDKASVVKEETKAKQPEASLTQEEEPAPEDKTAEANPAEEKILFQGEINSDGINIRSDATVTSEAISSMNRTEPVEVVSEAYDWYKIRLPKKAPSFIHKGLVALNQEKKAETAAMPSTARVLKNNVNIRLRPDTASPILGRAKQNDAVSILADAGDWYKIEPVKLSYGWIHKNFVNKIEKKESPGASKKAKKEEAAEEKDLTVVEGILRPKSMTSAASHKITSSSNILYLIKGNEEELDSFNRRKVKITGKIIDPSRINPIIEVRKIEALD